MLSGYSHNGKIRKFAETLATDQTGVASSLAAFVNGRHLCPGRRRQAERPAMLPSQASDLRRLSAVRGHGFDSIYVSAYVSAMTEALGQLQILYRDFARTGANPGLQAIADRELPKVEQTISALNAL